MDSTQPTIPHDDREGGAPLPAPAPEPGNDAHATTPDGAVDAHAVPVDPREFRHAMGRLAKGVSVITAVGADGTDHAMTADTVTSVSLDPLMMLCCVERASRFRDAAVAGGHWAASVLDDSGEQAAWWFATRGRPPQGQFDTTAHHRSPRGNVVLDASLAVFDVVTDQVVEAGDHTILIGRVEWMQLSDGDRGPLLFYRGRLVPLP